MAFVELTTTASGDQSGSFLNDKGQTIDYTLSGTTGVYALGSYGALMAQTFV